MGGHFHSAEPPNGQRAGQRRFEHFAPCVKEIATSYGHQYASFGTVNELVHALVAVFEVRGIEVTPLLQEIDKRPER
jgi:hypothetical protein